MIIQHNNANKILNLLSTILIFYDACINIFEAIMQ